MTDPLVRTIADDELEAFANVVRTAFVERPATQEQLELFRSRVQLDRSHAAFDGDGRLCGAAGAFGTSLTLPGGAAVPTGAVTAVGVLPTHIRRGHLTRLMRAQLADVAQRGEPLAALVAAEYPIYGRFGYGPATEAATLHLDSTTTRWRDEPAGSVELVEGEAWAKLVSELYERVRQSTPGHIDWPAWRWRVSGGVDPSPWEDNDKRAAPTRVVWRDEAGDVQGCATYTVEGTWKHNRPAGRLTADNLVTASGEAEIELLRYFASVDWASEVVVGLRPVDDITQLALVDGRAARLADRWDHVWVRVLDVPAALTARSYSGEGSLVFEIDDPLGFASGRFRLEAGADGATCVPTTDDADLVLSASALGAAYLGGTGWERLAAAGWVDERRAGAVARADRLFRTARAPWCAMTF
jgi:predicted acetyltransferase